MSMKLIFYANGKNKKGVLMRMFVPKRDEVDCGWRGLHNEELHNLLASPNIIIVMKSGMGEAGSTHERDEKCLQNLIVKSERRRLRIRSRRRWEDNIRLDLKEIRWESVAWIHLVQDRD